MTTVIVEDPVAPPSRVDAQTNPIDRTAVAGEPMTLGLELHANPDCAG